MAQRHGHSCGNDCDHRDDSPEMGIMYTLYTKVDIENVECLNEAAEGSGKLVFRAWDERLKKDKFVESDLDEELLFSIPFVGNVKLKGIIVIGGEGDSHPARMRIFKNRPHMTFEDAAIEADQEFEMQPDANGTLEYATKVVKFSSVHHLTIYFSKNFGNETSKVYYIGLRGEFTEATRPEVAVCTYELRPNPADHKLHFLDSLSNQVS